MSRAILVDTSIWVDHLRIGDDQLISLLDHGRVLAHPMVIGELACGRLHRRDAILGWLAELPEATVATHHEVLALIEAHGLMGRGIGYVDAHLLAATVLSAPGRLWTRDRPLRAAAQALDLAALHT